MPFSTPAYACGRRGTLLTGLVCISLGDNRALSPWTMGISYGCWTVVGRGDPALQRA